MRKAKCFLSDIGLGNANNVRGNGSLIPQHVIEDLRQRMDLVQVVEQITPLKRSGSNFMACCPFHQENSPSFHISHAKQLFHCFGCGVGGNLYHFLMKYHHFDFPNALEYVAKEVGFDLAPYQKQDQAYQDDQKIQNVLQYARDKFYTFLTDHPKGKDARAYLTDRGISPETVASYQLGLVPQGWDNLTNAIKRDGIVIEDAIKAGLISRKKTNKEECFDVFRNRLMIPIEDAKGKVIGFGARTMSNEQPKYINSPQTVLFDKSKVLYGLSRAEKAIRAEKNVFVVEGYFDQISLFDHGIENVVATMGTAMTAYHCAIIKRYCPRITLVFDGDQAGINACFKAAKSILPQGVDTDVIMMPLGMDPDSFVRKNSKEVFEKLPRSSLLDFLVKHFYQQTHELAQKTQFLQELVEIVANSKNPYIAKVLKDEICAKMDLDPAIFQEKPSFTRPVPVQKESNTTKEAGKGVSKEAVMALVVYAQNESIQAVMNLDDLLIYLMDEDLSQYGRHCMEDPMLSSEPAKWIDHWAKPAYKAMLTQVLMSFEMSAQETASEKIWADCFSKIKKNYMRKLVKDIERAEHAGQADLVEDLSKKMFETKKFQPLITG